MDHLYDDYRIVTDRTIDSHIKNLRRKLEQLNDQIEFIRSIYADGAIVGKPQPIVFR